MDEQSIFLGALEKTSTEEVAKWLDANCGSDREFRERVEEMLRSHHEANSFLERPVDELMEATCLATEGAAAASGHASVLRSIGKRYGAIKGVALPDSDGDPEDPVVRVSSPLVPKSDVDDRYQFLGEIARGGMGAVIKGRDTDLGRDLAVKVLLEDHKDKPEVIQRFIEEAQIGGQLQHPGIAPVYELGEFADDRPFFTMKLVKGKTLAALLSERETRDQDQAKLLGIFEQVCQTMAYAHSRSVIHRDLKPANIMVGAFGEVQVMDWGLAKVLQTGGIADETKAANKPKEVSIIETIRSGGSRTSDGAVVGSQTRDGSVMGTPAYMSPEQAAGEADMLDTRADVFGLGAILCEILTGSPPYVADDGHEILRMARRGHLGECQQRLKACSARRELIELTHRCLTSDPGKRLKDAGVVAGHITNHLESVARKLKQAEIRRKLTYVVAASLLLVVTSLGAGAVWLQAKETEAANHVAAAQHQRAEEKEAANEELRESVYVAKVQLAGSHVESGRMTEGLKILETLRPQREEKDLRGFEWHYLRRRCPVWKTVGVTDWAEYLGTIPLGHEAPALRRAHSTSDDGNRILVRWGLPVSFDNVNRPTYKVTVFDCKLKREIWSTMVSGRKFCLSPSGKKVAIYNRTENVVELIDLDNQERIVLRPPENAATPLMNGLFDRLEFSPTGEHLASFTWHRRASDPSRSAASRAFYKSLGEEVPGPQPAHPVTLVLWNTKNGVIHYQKEFPQTTNPDGFAFSPDGSQILTVDISDSDGPSSATITLWDVASGDKVRMLALDPGQRPSLRFPRGASGSRFGGAFWLPNNRPGAPTFSSDGSLISMTGTNLKNANRPSLWIWELHSGKRIFSREVGTRSYKAASFSPDSRFILHHGGDIFRIRDGERLATLDSFADTRLGGIRISVDGQFVDAVADDGRRLRWKSPLSDESNSDMHGRYFVSAGGERMGWFPAARVRDDDMNELMRTRDHSGKLTPLRFPVKNASIMYFSSTTDITDDGRFLALLISDVPHSEVTFDTPRALTVWNMSNSTRHATLWRQTDNNRLSAARFVPKRDWLLGVIREGRFDGELENPAKDQLVLWDVTRKTVVHSLEIPSIGAVAFSANGRQLAVAYTERDDNDHRQSYLSIYSMGEMKEVHKLLIAPMPADLTVSSRISFRPGRNEIAVASSESVDLWDLDQVAVRQSLSGLSGQEAFAWTADGTRFITLRKESEQGNSIMTVWNPENGQPMLVQGTKCFVIPGNSLKCIPGTNKLFSWAGNRIQYLDGTPLTEQE